MCCCLARAYLKNLLKWSKSKPGSYLFPQPPALPPCDTALNGPPAPIKYLPVGFFALPKHLLVLWWLFAHPVCAVSSLTASPHLLRESPHHFHAPCTEETTHKVFQADLPSSTKTALTFPLFFFPCTNTFPFLESPTHNQPLQLMAGASGSASWAPSAKGCSANPHSTAEDKEQ